MPQPVGHHVFPPPRRCVYALLSETSPVPRPSVCRLSNPSQNRDWTLVHPARILRTAAFRGDFTCALWAAEWVIFTVIEQRYGNVHWQIGLPSMILKRGRKISSVYHEKLHIVCVYCLYIMWLVKIKIFNEDCEDRDWLKKRMEGRKMKTEK